MRPGLIAIRGQTLTEFALVIPVVVLLFVGIVDLGRMVYAYNAVSNAAREGGRTGIVNQTVSAIRQQAAAQATGLEIDTSPPTCTAGVPSGPSGVCVEFRTSNLASICSPPNLGCVSVVTVKYSFRAITPIIGNIVGTVPLTATTKQPIEALCTDSGTTVCPLP
jgi:Flp pilus assembly protein TadG